MEWNEIWIVLAVGSRMYGFVIGNEIDSKLIRHLLNWGNK